VGQLASSGPTSCLSRSQSLESEADAKAFLQDFFERFRGGATAEAEDPGPAAATASTARRLAARAVEQRLPGVSAYLRAEADDESNAESEGYEDYEGHEAAGLDEQELTAAVGLENYNWVNDPGPHPGVRGLGTQPGTLFDDGDRRVSLASEETGEEELVDGVLDEFEELMAADPSTAPFLRVLAQEIRQTSAEQQRRVILAVRTALAAGALIIY
jgi:hypothetical protein